MNEPSNFPLCHKEMTEAFLAFNTMLYELIIRYHILIISIGEGAVNN